MSFSKGVQKTKYALKRLSSGLSYNPRTDVSAEMKTELETLGYTITEQEVFSFSDNFSLNFSDDILDSGWREPETENELMKYYHSVLQDEVIEAIGNLDEKLPENIKKVYGTLSDFFENSEVLDRAGFESRMFEEMLHLGTITNKEFSVLNKLEEPYPDELKNDENIEKRKQKEYSKLQNAQEKMLTLATDSYSKISKILNKSFPGILIEDTGELNLKDVDDINLDAEDFFELTTVLKDYVEISNKAYQIKNSYSHRAFDDFKNDFLMLTNWNSQSLKNTGEKLVDAINSPASPRARIELMGHMSSLLQEIHRDKNRAERFLSGEKFWPNDTSGGIYTDNFGKPKMVLCTPNAVKMSAYMVDSGDNYEYYETGRDVLEEGAESVSKEMANIVLHEYGHYISHSAKRKEYEKLSGTDFKDVNTVFKKVKSLGGVASALLDSEFGEYSLFSPNEFFAEFIKFSYASPTSAGEIKKRFHSVGLSDEYNMLAKLIGQI